jgi:hypothetical protein
MPHTYRNIFELNIKYIDYLISKSLFSHQYIHNIAQSGADVENEIREIFRNIIPERYKVTHGYIVSAPNQISEPRISPQVDMMIVDTLVPHSLLIVDKKSGLEIVPLEAVLAIFEIKRSLSFTTLVGNETMQGAISHLGEIKSTTGIVKNSLERFGPGGITFGNGLSGGFYCNPLLGIIGLDMDDNLINPDHQHYLSNTYAQLRETEIDLISCFKGFLCAVRNDQQPTWFRIANPRVLNQEINYLLLDKDHNRNQAELIARMFGYIVGYLYNTNGKVANINNYFFNQTLSNHF